MKTARREKVYVSWFRPMRSIAMALSGAARHDQVAEWLRRWTANPLGCVLYYTRQEFRRRHLLFSMFIEIEETVRFLSTYMYGRIPRSRVKSFAVHLTSLLSEMLINNDGLVCRYDLVVHAEGRTDDVIVQAAKMAYVRMDEFLECVGGGLIIEMFSGRVRALTPNSAQVVYPKGPFY
ncbi:unnamed protein product [Caenorhabditis auriculariae]|uniref:Uncharacterized protein n=1 Tax=Caenorhabditis auriculariae TaxID=2777116 RepID=A0A8S1GQ47_9PELO|nr:unnamed protein product [Caenorhabditis auriculariae]